MKKILILIAALVFLTAFASCGDGYKDGVYMAQSTSFDSNGWKDDVTVTIIDGKIADVQWDAVSGDPDIPIKKKQYSKSGLYGMLLGAAQNEWCDQAKVIEQYVITDGIGDITLDSEGKTDAISGCTIEIDNFAALVNDCLAQAER
jgi:major membrane immunogen (membrane-anchored lipoprotein)